MYLGYFNFNLKGENMDINHLNQMYAIGLARLELAQHKGDLRVPAKGDATKIFEYFTSTSNRRAFGIKCVICGLVREDCTPRSLAKELGISINGIDTMITECEAEAWIDVTRAHNNYRYVRGSKKLVDQYVIYATAVADFSTNQDFLGIQAARRYANATLWL